MTCGFAGEKVGEDQLPGRQDGAEAMPDAGGATGTAGSAELILLVAMDEATEGFTDDRGPGPRRSRGGVTRVGTAQMPSETMELAWIS
jgi:hypothetical protein